MKVFATTNWYNTPLLLLSLGLSACGARSALRVPDVANFEDARADTSFDSEVRMDAPFDTPIDLPMDVLPDVRPDVVQPSVDVMLGPCPGVEVVPVTQVVLPNTIVQLAYDNLWASVRSQTINAGSGAVLLEDRSTSVAGAVFAERARTGSLRSEASRIEAALLALGAIGTVVGREVRTHENFAAIVSTYQWAVAGTNATAVRDTIFANMTGVPAITGGVSVGTASDFLVELATSERLAPSGERWTQVVLTVAPRTLSEDARTPTGPRTTDLLDGTMAARSGRNVALRCQTLQAGQAVSADFLWTVDTSGSMREDQMRVAEVAELFFSQLRGANLNFRVGVLQAGYSSLNLDTPGFRWIDGSDANGARRLCEEITSVSLGTCPASPSERLSPYPMVGQENPMAASVLAHYEFWRRGERGETNLDRRFRPGARVVAFHVTDETGNDYRQYFATQRDPQTGQAWGSTYNAATFANILAYFRRNGILTFGLVQSGTNPCTNYTANDLNRCLIEANGGAIIPITGGTRGDIAPAINRILASVLGDTSGFRLATDAITSTVRVRYRGMSVPRSRTDGFDYTANNRTLVFYGSRFRPAPGEFIEVSHQSWE